LFTAEPATTAAGVANSETMSAQAELQKYVLAAISSVLVDGSVLAAVVGLSA
jgi:hypothetical protein